MLTDQELVRRLNIFDKKEAEFSKLDKMRETFVLNQIHASDIQSLTQEYKDDLDILIENTKLNLAKVHDNALTINYEERVIDLFEADFEEAKKALMMILVFMKKRKKLFIRSDWITFL